MKRILLIVMVMLLAGCWDVNEPERMYYIHAVGVDYKDGQYEIYVQVIDFVNVAKTEQPNPDAIQSEIGLAKGETINEAFLKLYHSMDLKLFWGHLTYVVLSEEVLKEGRTNSVLTLFSHYRETRYQIWYYATDGDLKDILLATPILNKAITLSKLADPLNSFDQESYLAPISMRKLIIGINEPSHEIAIPYIKISENWETEKGKSKATEVDGVSVFTPTEYKGNITGEEAMGLMWMTNETKRGQVTIGKNMEAFTAIIEHLKVKVEAIEKDGDLKFKVNVHVNAILGNSNRDVNEKEIIEGVKKKVKEQIETTYKVGLENDMDIYRLSENAYRQQLKAWKKVQVDGKVPLNEDSIEEVKVVVEKINSGRKNFDLRAK